MKLRQNLQDIYNRLVQSDNLLRLLYYPTNPLDNSHSNIVGSANHLSVADKHVFWTPKTTDLVNAPTCRLCVYAGNRTPISSNYITSFQDFVFDVYVHIEEFDQKDLRLTWIADEINSLVSMTRITGIGKIEFVDGIPILNAPEGYVGYRLVYQFGSGN